MQPESTAMVPPFVAQDRAMAEALEQIIGRATFQHWFRDHAAIRVEAGRAVIEAENAFLLAWIQRELRPQAVEAARLVFGPDAEVLFRVRAKTEAASKPPREAAPISASAKPTAPSAAAPVVQPSAPPARASDPPAAQRRLADLADFVKSPGSELAWTAAQAVCQAPGVRYNPLVLHGGVGLGKTHLLEGIYRRVRAAQPALRVLLLTAEEFANCFTQALRNHALPGFRQKFRNLDMLMVDDVDFLDGKRVIFEEFLHTFKHLESHQRQIVVTLDRHPRMLSKSSEEVVTRLLSGVACRVEPPDVGARRDILHRKAARLTCRIAPEALDHVAQRFDRSVRELEGALNCLETFAAMTGRAVSASAARQVLADLQQDCLRVVRLPDVEQAICRTFGVEPVELRSGSRSRAHSQPRMLAMYLARKLTRSAYSEIGQYFGGRNHSTVISAEKRIEAMVASKSVIRIAAQNWAMNDLMSALEHQLLAS